MDTVLIIDDEEDIRNILEYNLKKEGFSVYTSENGAGGIELAKQVNPDIIILDLMLPGMDGFAILKELKASAKADVPVIIFSNKDNPADREQAATLGAAAFYVKAMTDLSELLNVIEKYAKK